MSAVAAVALSVFLVAAGIGVGWTARGARDAARNGGKENGC